eukprot:COSAG06_NODE_21288_length_762_cov_1.476621_1_plen_136_part_01
MGGFSPARGRGGCVRFLARAWGRVPLPRPRAFCFWRPRCRYVVAAGRGGAASGPMVLLAAAVAAAAALAAAAASSPVLDRHPAGGGDGQQQPLLLPEPALRLTFVSQPAAPIIDTLATPGTQDNLFGFEGGRAIKQ